MKEDFIIPRECIRLLLLQRSQYRLPTFRILRKWMQRARLDGVYNQFLIGLVESLESLRSRKISGLYRDDLAATFSTMEEILPPVANRILDIGAGMGGIDLMLYRKYNANPELFLLDKEGVSNTIVAGFHESPSEFSKYNSFSQARRFLTSNGVDNKDVTEINIDVEPFPDTKFDLVVSLLSWGFHYPIETYLSAVRSVLASQGVLIIDVRKGTRGIEALTEGFGTIPRVLHEGEKFLRVGIVKPSELPLVSARP